MSLDVDDVLILSVLGILTLLVLVIIVVMVIMIRVGRRIDRIAERTKEAVERYDEHFVPHLPDNEVQSPSNPPAEPKG